MDTADISGDFTTRSGSGTTSSHHVNRSSSQFLNMLRVFVIATVATCAFIASNVVFVIATMRENYRMESRFELQSNRLIEAMHTRIRKNMIQAQTISNDLSLAAAAENAGLKKLFWPYVTFPNFDIRCNGIYELSEDTITSIAFSPLVETAKSQVWETYVRKTYEYYRTSKSSIEKDTISSSKSNRLQFQLLHIVNPPPSSKSAAFRGSIESNEVIFSDNEYTNEDYYIGEAEDIKDYHDYTFFHDSSIHDDGIFNIENGTVQFIKSTSFLSAKVDADNFANPKSKTSTATSEDNIVISSPSAEYLLPLYQMMLVASNSDKKNNFGFATANGGQQQQSNVIGYNQFSNPVRLNAFEAIMTAHQSSSSLQEASFSSSHEDNDNVFNCTTIHYYDGSISNFLFHDSNGTDFRYYDTPHSVLYYPIYQNAPRLSSSSSTLLGSSSSITLNDKGIVVGTLSLEWNWGSIFQNVLNDNDYEASAPLVIVLESSSSSYKNNSKFSFQVVGNHVHFLGEGDMHDTSLDSVPEPISSSFKSFEHLFLKTIQTKNNCSSTMMNFRVTIHATAEYKHLFMTKFPTVLNWVTLGLFMLLISVFLCYDCYVDRHEKFMISKAAQSNEIVSSFFPANVRDRLFAKDSTTVNAGRMQKKPSMDVNNNNISSNSTLIQTQRGRLRGFLNLGSGHGDNSASNMSTTRGTTDGNYFDSEFTTNDLFLDEPIADLFPNATVLFADIAGFTAWCSERDPSQVFTLLETLYQSMDKIARKLKVFKVETIGDCYVAATGLPKPQDDHAEIMLRFARATMYKNRALTVALEEMLGPGTSDLAMRYGCHSGPITAGVLRGEKCRFQLFGDTMNMASRMESTGLRNKVQLSKDTAKILISRGKGHWITQRERSIEIKGKGKTETYWLLIEGEGGSEGSSVIYSQTSTSTLLGGIGGGDFDEELGNKQERTLEARCPFRCNSFRSLEQNSSTSFEQFPIVTTNPCTTKNGPKSCIDDVVGQTAITESQQRLVDWNTEVLASVLQKVVAARDDDQDGSVANDDDEQSKDWRKRERNNTDTTEEMTDSSCMQTHTASQHSHNNCIDSITLISRKTTFLDEVEMAIPLPQYNRAAAHRVIKNGGKKLSVVVKSELRQYIALIASGYRKNEFHNFEHASHVILSATKLMKRIVEADGFFGTDTTAVGDIEQQQEQPIHGITTEELHEYTYGISSDPLVQFAVVFSALVHDVGHTGVPNEQLAKEHPEIAQKYIHRSIAEQRSIDVAFALLKRSEFDNLRQCIFTTQKEKQRFRKLVVNSVMATDIFDKELKTLRNSRWEIAFHNHNNNDGAAGEGTQCAHLDKQPASMDINITNADIAPSEEEEELNRHRKATIVIEHIIQASDVAHTMQHWHVYQKWNERLFNELYGAYVEGRSSSGTDPSIKWYAGELWFFDNYVIPLARKLKECGVFGVSSDEYLNYAIANREEWEFKGEYIVKAMLDRYYKNKEQN